MQTNYHLPLQLAFSLAFYILYFTPTHAQFDIDYYGKHPDYKSDIVSVSSLYYKPIYVEDSITYYELEPYEIVPHASIAHFNEEGQLVLFEEYDTHCGFDSTCLKNYYTYRYENGQLINEERHVSWSTSPRNISYSYRNEGDSIFYETEKRPNYVRFKTTKTKRLITKEQHKAPGLITLEATTLDSLGQPKAYEKYYKDALIESRVYRHFKEGKKTRQEAMVTNHRNGRTALRAVNYDENGLLSSWEIYDHEGNLYSKTDFKHQFDDKGNWTERKIYNKLGREMYKVVKTYVYRDE